MRTEQATHAASAVRAQTAGTTATQPWRDQGALLREVKDIAARKSAIECEIEGLTADREEAKAEFRAAEDKAARHAARMRMEVIDRGLVLAGEKLEAVSKEEARARRQVDPARMADAVAADVALEAHVRKVLAARDQEAEPLDRLVQELGQRVARVVQLDAAAYRLALPLLGSAGYACDPDPKQLATAILGAFLRASGRGDDFLASPQTLDNVRNTEPPSQIVSRQRRNILEHLPSEMTT